MHRIIPMFPLVLLAPLLSACAMTDGQELDCDAARDILAGCGDGSDPAVCGDDAPAATLLSSGECTTSGGKADLLGNAGYGDACTWDWQCGFDQGLICQAGHCTHEQIESPCSLPTPDYLAMTAEQKQEALFTLHERSPAVPTFGHGALEDAHAALFAVSSFVLPPNGAKSITHTFTRSCDVFAEPQTKQVHALGTVAEAHLRIDDDSPFTGLFAPGEVVPALIRFSIANPVIAPLANLSDELDFDLMPPRLLEFIPGIGIKLFVDGRQSENILAMDSLAGQGSDHNYFLHDFTNNFTAHAPDSEDPEIRARYEKNPVNHHVMCEVGKRFVEALHLVGVTDNELPFHRPVTGLARVRVDGTDVANPFSPDWLVFAPSSEVLNNPVATDSEPGVDFRDKLASLHAGTVVFDIFAVTGGIQRHIGVLELESTPSPSEWGDHNLFMQHPL